MNDDKRQTPTDWRLAMSARTIVAAGVWSLIMVLVGTSTVGVGPEFLALMALTFATLIAIILCGHPRGS
ncbi:MAG: hypothetical protein WCO00_05870 [Rhodospirillaceae bacterium]